MEYHSAGEACVQEARDAWNLVGKELLEFRAGLGLGLPIDWYTDDQTLEATRAATQRPAPRQCR